MRFGLSHVVGSLVISIVALGLGGCLFIGSSTEKKAPRPTVGQELVDLKIAHEKGAISESEYDASKRRLLDELRER